MCENMDFQNNNYRGKYYRGRGRGRGRGSRGGFRKHPRGSHKRQYNDERPYYHQKTKQNYDTISCNTHAPNDTRLIDTDSRNNRGWHQKGWNQNSTLRPAINEDTISTFSEIKLEPRLMEKDVESKISYNEWDSPEDRLHMTLKKPVNKIKPKIEPKFINNDPPQNEEMLNKFETNNSQKTERSNTSMASDLTKNSRSEGFDRNMIKAEVSKFEKCLSYTDNVPKGALNEFQNTSSVKKSKRTFAPREKKQDTVLDKGTLQLRILLKNKQLARMITCDLLSEPTESRPTLIVKNSDGKQLLLGVDVDKIAENINKEINPSLDLRWEMR